MEYPPVQKDPLIATKEAPPSYDAPPVCVQTGPKRWGEISERIKCVNCQQEVLTRIESKVGLGSWVAVGIVAWILLAFGLIFCVPFALIALLLDFTKDKQHVCPNCGFVNGVKKAFH
ncbi:Lipopolysaccharide-induced tumor necrosis factor-alpha factor-like [Oopsacas minuta]|uniref:Lipopolysaccharide-induced tumor necrosis factor-alpha factor-like n=1 Tax=Oopsacas minuta TaxID=111878 RepID=A0AAV7J7W7_9METZ|nr:Lipopolysaccharide-induced tumor necrosis factor-alpha factor-like [Oopsacas minuta]